jgi:peptidoglycan/xylan/chitin deacetylase (PgdA/CDA1 family)
VPATLYVATDFVDRGRAFPDDGTPLSWAALRDAAATGLVTVGSHTHTHALLDRLPAPDVASELDRACDLIATHVGTPPAHFAYPKAVLGSPAAEAEVRRRHRSAAVAGTRPNRFGATDPYRLARSPIQVADGMTFFHAKAAGGMRLEDDLRAAANRWRYRKLAG